MLIENQHELATFCASLAGSPAIFVDTEFVGEGRYYPDVGAIQVAVPERAALIDPLALDDLGPLLALMTDPRVEKVFHAATQDLQIFYRFLGEPVFPIFDTQVAAALLGYEEQISFLNIVDRATGAQLSKAHSFTDWLRRPLTPGQLEYALDDVRYLIPVHRYLVDALTTRGRLEWAREEFRRLEDPDRFRPADPRELYLRIRGVERLRGTALNILCELAAWREETARKQNIPVGRVARDEVLLEFARRPRTSTGELHELRGLTSQQIDRFGAAMIAASQRGGKAPRPASSRSGSLPATLEPTVDFLILCLRALATEQGIAPGLVATRGDLTELVLAGEHADIALMRGWRRTAIGDPLLATLEGKATARILPDNRQVHLDWHATAPGMPGE